MFNQKFLDDHIWKDAVIRITTFRGGKVEVLDYLKTKQGMHEAFEIAFALHEAKQDFKIEFVADLSGVIKKIFETEPNVA